MPALQLATIGFPSTRAAWLAAGADRIRHVDIAGRNHDLSGQAPLVEEVADAMAELS